MRALKRPVLKAVMLAASLLVAAGSPARAAGSEPDTAMVIEGGSEGKVFRKMTIEGEDRFRIDFERPELRIDLDPATAPGLDWDNTWDVLAEGDIDLWTPLVGMSASWQPPYMARPWLDMYASGEIVRFKPALSGVERWKLTIADSRSGEVRSFEGKGNPPKVIGWDGLSQDGSPMPPGYTYSYVVEAWDRAGNKRNFVGKGFGLPPYRVGSGDDVVFLFTGEDIDHGSASRRSGVRAPEPLILEAASRINQAGTGRSVRVVVTARTYDKANTMAEDIAGSLGSLVIGGPARIRHIADVRDDAPEAGTVALVLEPDGEQQSK